MKTQRGPRLVFSLTCDGCACHSVKPDGRRYCRALNGSRMVFDPEPLEGSFPPINDGNQEALRQLTQEP